MNIPVRHKIDLDKSAIPSPFRELIGLRIVEWERDRCVTELDVRPDLLNFSGAIAGPVVGAIIDMSGNLAGCYSDEAVTTTKAVTLSFTVGYISTVRAGTIRAVATKQGGGRTIYTSTIQVFSETGEMIATGQGTFRYVR